METQKTKFVSVIKYYSKDPVGFIGGGNFGFGKGSLEYINDKILLTNNKGEKLEFGLVDIENSKVVISYSSGWDSYLEFTVLAKGYCRAFFNTLGDLLKVLDMLLSSLERSSIEYRIKGSFSKPRFVPFGSSKDELEIVFNEDTPKIKRGKESKLKELIEDYKRVQIENRDSGLLGRYFVLITRDPLLTIVIHSFLGFGLLLFLISMYENNLPKVWAEPLIAPLRLLMGPLLVYLTVIIVAATSIEDYKIYSYRLFKKRFFRMLIPILIFGVFVYFFRIK